MKVPSYPRSELEGEGERKRKDIKWEEQKTTHEKK